MRRLSQAVGACAALSGALATTPCSAETSAATEWFTDVEGERRSFELEYHRQFAHRQDDPSYFRALGEIGLVVLGGAIHYWWNHDVNRLDWDFPTLADRMTFRGIRLDNNSFVTNNLLHPMAGGSYYGLARLNGMNVPYSILYSNVASALWEYALEYREKVSINDQVVTTAGGVAFGEFVFQLGEYLNSGSGGVVQTIAAHTAGLPRAYHRWTGDEPGYTMPLDELGFSSAFGHDFSLSYAPIRVESAGKQASLHAIEAEGEIVSVPGFGRPGHFDVLFAEGNFTESRIRVAFEPRGIGEADLWFRAQLAGFYHQDYQAAPQGLSGHAVLTAVGTALTFHNYALLGQRDRVGVAHFVGPTLQTWLAEGGLELRLSFDTYGDFAAIRSQAFPLWQAAHPDATPKSVLSRQGDQYHLGFSSRSRATLTYDPIELGGSFAFGRYESIDGLDRQQDAIDNDPPGREYIVQRAGWVRATLPGLPVHTRLTLSERDRSSRLGEFRAELNEFRVTATLGLRL